MAIMYYGHCTPVIHELIKEGIMVQGPEYLQHVDWAPKYYCKPCGIAFPGFSKV